MNFKDYYEALGVERDATQDAIKRAYRKLAHKYHPDVSKDPKGEAKFKDVAEAYATLKDPEKRQAYDDLGRRPAGEAFTPPPEWQQQFHPGGSGFDDVDLSDLFAAFGAGRHGSASRRNVPMAGQDFETTANVTLEQIFRGGEIDVHAELPQYDDSGLGHRVARTFRITIPRGAENGQRLRLSGQGGPGQHGARSGDLYVVLALQPDARFRVDGRDLYLNLPLAPWEAVLGAVVRVPTLDGEVELQIKPGTVAGQKMRLARRGLVAKDGSIGALYAVVSIVVPQKATEREKELFTQLAEESVFEPRPAFGQTAHEGASP